MCGIAGLWAPRIEPAERLALVARMVERLRHRGPSGTALWEGDGLALGIARLAIVARHSPASVLANEDDGLRAVVNGEIYNHAALLADLRRRGHEVPDGPDTALLPHLYEEEGAGFPARLDGQFAAALWDRRARRLTLARDRAGEKPLFVARFAHGCAFASEPAALVTLPWVSRDPSAEALARYLVHGFFAGEDCGFAAVRQLAPAHVLELGEGFERATRYWRPWDALVPGAAREAAWRGGLPPAPAPAAAPGDRAAAARPMRADAAPAAALAALESAVASRVPAEVPFGVFLSGGIDSGLVATLTRRAVGPGFPTFSLQMAHRGYDESGFAREVADAIGSEHHVLTMDAAAGEEALDVYAATMDQPLGDPSVLPTWALARLASRHVPVVLTGEAGDELFAGYPTYLGHRHAALADALPGPLAAAGMALARRFRPAHHHVTIAHLVERFLATRGVPPFERHLRWFGTAAPDEARTLLAPALRAAVDERAPLRHATTLARRLAEAGVVRDPRRPGLVAYQLLDFELYLAGDLLTKVDRCTMAHGVESRAPFLRPALVEFALALPEAAKVRGGALKWALREAARGLLPADVPGRRKQGFSPPFAAWARGPLRARVDDALARERVARAGVLDPDAVRAVVEAHLENRADRGRTLWTLLSLQLWAEGWVAGGRADAGAAGLETAPPAPAAAPLAVAARR